MLVSVSGKGKGGTEIIEGEAIEERGGEEVEAAEEEVIQAAHGGRIEYQRGGPPGGGDPGMSKADALEEVRSKPMFSEGGRVKAQGGLFAGQMPGRHPGMNQMNPMGMNQGLGAPNLGSRSMGMTPGMGQQPMDPRMAQMMQAQKLQGGLRRPIPKESEDTELIQLIKMLTALVIPMEQLRGRT